MKIHRGLATSEKGIFFVSVLLSIIGLLFVFEASVAEAFTTFGDQFFFVRQQAIWFVIGLFGLGAGILIPSTVWKKCAPFIYGASIFLLLAVFLPGLGKEVNGARRWVELPGFNFQPVEIAKFGIITFFASWLSKHQKLAPFLFLTLLPVALLFLQPDMGSALIVLGISFGLYFLSGARLKTISLIFGAGLIALSLAIVVSPYRLKRMTTFINPESDPLGASFHIRQITLALGNGGWVGQGIGKSRQKFSYIPEASTDSIFAIVAEEVGFMGSLALFLLFASYFHFGYLILKKVKQNTYDYLLAAGCILWIGLQVLLNLSAVVALVPLTGIPLPFFSYGGTSLVMILCVTGILIGIGRRAEHQQTENKTKS
jgi:cell division protein FtsW